MAKTFKKHYVDFYSPGTFVSEHSRKPIDKWDSAQAVEFANGITERYGAKPYGFRFVTMLEAEPVSDGQGGTLKVQPREVARTGMFYLGGKAIRFDDVPDDKEHSILRSNMQCNDYPVIIENTNSWRFTTWFTADDAIVDADGTVKVKGDDADLVAYRAAKIAEWSAEREQAMATR